MRRLVVALLVALLATGTAAASELKALVGGTLIDGYGNAPLRDSVVLIRGERIEAVGQVGLLEIPAEAEVISTEGMTVLPGLWDLQVRLMRLGHASLARWDEAYVPIAERVVMPAAARQLLLSGVTSARDVGAPLEAAISVRDRIRDRRIPGPTLWVSGPALEHEPGRPRPYRLGVAGAADAREKAERLVRAGVDFLLLADLDQLTDAELAAIVSVGRTARLPVHAEIRRDAEIARALAAGVDGLVGFGNGTTPTLPEDALRLLRERAARDAPLPWSAGVSALVNLEWLRTNPEPLDEPRWREGLPPIVADDVRASLRNLDAITWFEWPALRRPVLGPRLRSALEAGARVVVGSDAGVPGHVHTRATWQEVESLVLEGGMSPMEAIRAATYWPAVLMGVQHEVGTVTPGKYADVIAVRGNPLRHVERLQDVEIVIRRGLRHR